MTDVSSTEAQSVATALKNKFIEQARVSNAIADTNTRSGRRVFKETVSKEEEKAQELSREEFALELVSSYVTLPADIPSKSKTSRTSGTFESW